MVSSAGPGSIPGSSTVRARLAGDADGAADSVPGGADGTRLGDDDGDAFVEGALLVGELAELVGEQFGFEVGLPLAVRDLLDPAGA